jgi:type VI secretion system protein ImpB
MAASINDEIPKSRITLTYRTEVSGEREDVVLPFRVLIMGDLSGGSSKDRDQDLDQRQIRTLDGKNLDAVMADMNLSVELEVPNAINPDTGGGTMKVHLPITSMRSFSPAEVAANVPKIRALLLLKKLLLEAQANLDNRKEFRGLMRKLAADPKAIAAIRSELPEFDAFELPAGAKKAGEPAAKGLRGEHHGRDYA